MRRSTRKNFTNTYVRSFVDEHLVMQSPPEVEIRSTTVEKLLTHPRLLTNKEEGALIYHP